MIIDTDKGCWLIVRSTKEQAIEAIEFCEWWGIKNQLQDYQGAVMNSGCIVRRLYQGSAPALAEQKP